MFKLCAREFHLIRVGLVRAACPQELNNTPPNRLLGAPIVILRNHDKLGSIQATSYTPLGIIVAGAKTRASLLDEGYTRSWAYVEAGAVEIQADDEIGSSELMQKLENLLNVRLYGSNQPITGQPWPYIIEVYPFENYFIYQLKGQKYRQHFTLDPVERKVGLTGGAIAVNEKFVNADCKESMPRSETGARYAYAPMRGNTQSFTMGGKNSELVTQIVRNWGNILEAVSMYLNYTRNAGTKLKPQMTPAFRPVNLSPEGKILGQLAAQGIDVYDFAKWSAAIQAAKTKSKDGLPSSAYAYVGDKNDPSTWHLKIHDATHVRNALARINQTQGIPGDKKGAVMSKLRGLAKKHKIDVSDKATPGQKKWLKSGFMPVTSPTMPSMPMSRR